MGHEVGGVPSHKQTHADDEQGQRVLWDGQLPAIARGGGRSVPPRSAVEVAMTYHQRWFRDSGSQGTTQNWMRRMSLELQSEVAILSDWVPAPTATSIC